MAATRARAGSTWSLTTPTPITSAPELREQRFSASRMTTEPVPSATAPVTSRATSGASGPSGRHSTAEARAATLSGRRAVPVRSVLQPQREHRAGAHRAFCQRQQVVAEGCLIHDRVAPVVTLDALGDELCAEAVAVAPDRVDAQPVLHRHSS